jgi:hypothetical protein
MMGSKIEGLDSVGSMALQTRVLEWGMRRDLLWVMLLEIQ